jgi:hypothetical protein
MRGAAAKAGGIKKRAATTARVELGVIDTRVRSRGEPDRDGGMI